MNSALPTPFTRLETARLVIRPLTADDAGSLFAYRSDPDVYAFQGWAPVTLADAHAFLAPMLELDAPMPGQWFQVGLCLRESGELIGDCGICLSADMPRHAEFGITIRPGQQKCGFAREALHAVIDYLFSTLHLHRISASVDPRNVASVALLKSIGMRQEAHFVQSYWSKGEWADDLAFALLQSEWGSPERQR